MGCASSTIAVPDGTSLALTASPGTAAPTSEISFIKNYDTYGKNRFKGTVAAKYLSKQGLPPYTLDTAWNKDADKANKVAAAMLEWAKDQGAAMATHIFQPLGSTGMRLGQTGQVHNAMFNFNTKSGELEWVFDGGALLKGETDGSSYMNGGMRVTHTAGGYTAIDPTSPVFIRGDTMYIPTVFVSWHGDALDEKTP